MVNAGEWCELLNQGLARSNGLVRKLKEELSIVSGRGESEVRRKEGLIQEERFRRRWKKRRRQKK